VASSNTGKDAGHYSWRRHDWSNQVRTQAKMLAAFPLTTSKNKSWCNYCRSLGSPVMSSFLQERRAESICMKRLKP